MLRIPTAPPTHAPYYFHKGSGKSMVIRRSHSASMSGNKEGDDLGLADRNPLPPRKKNQKRKYASHSEILSIYLSQNTYGLHILQNIRWHNHQCHKIHQNALVLRHHS